MTANADRLEEDRLALQAELDGLKTQPERNRLGQFATPTLLARDILAYGLSLLPKHEPVRFMDPAIGTGSFYSALLACANGHKVAAARGFEIDPHYGEPARKLWEGTPLQITMGDFTRQDPPAQDAEKPNLLICNPPYVRHHHLAGEDKLRLQALGQERAHIRLSGLAGLYCHFMALSHTWMAPNGVAGWLIPSEFMDVNYGRKLKQYLLREVTLLHIHRFDPNDVQFNDALVSSAVVWFRQGKPAPDHQVMFSYGGTLQAPTTVKHVGLQDLEKTEKWTRFPRSEVEVDHEGYRLGDLFAIKRGLATGDNGFFIIDEAKAKELQLPPQFLQPVLPSTRHVKAEEIKGDAQGVPLLDKRLFLINCNLPEEVVQRDYPALWSYLKTGIEHVAPRYLCRSRKVWYGQEDRPAAPIVCTYLGRSDHAGRPFRFILNESKATATNVFLMLYPKPRLAERLAGHPEMLRAVWRALNAIKAESLLGSGRVYGGGLHKLEPKELASVPADDIAEIAGLRKKDQDAQLALLEEALAT
ncbi:SAM-dependent DNA methyltransferase [Quisquiliibacterium transsilvanicum]|uniref:site-specific DNA-methyltransferase (adenine-specific) n=1 Tax=Quisquiliibacterium transsilvanicum TaxID=1549638 RepID=A0A7W8HG99_9BURK|nr:SAM-dependent DNA methyltransferase [Quisquiliibacterium transsilvanicum]MBB5271524.1 hypothetical protein [Quisquiliibacterium transsilvanicum]